MKLPGPNYGRGQSSFGRDPTDPTQVSRALFAAATAETGVGDAYARAGHEMARAGNIQAETGEKIAGLGRAYLHQGAAEAQAGASVARSGEIAAHTGSQMVRTGEIMFAQTTARGGIAKAIGQTADVFDAWDKASDQVRMHEGLARYVSGMSATMDALKKNLTIKVSDLPEGITLSKEDEGQEYVPTWKVIPQLYDRAEREFSKDAQNGITRVEHRQELALQLANKRATNSASISSHYMTERRKDLVGRSEETIRAFVQAGKPHDAVRAVESGFKDGIYDFTDRVKKIDKIWHDDEDLTTARRLADTANIPGLTIFAEEVLYKRDSRLTPDERRAYANTAIAKSEAIARQDEIRRNREERDASKRVLGTLGERIRLHGYIPTHQDLMEAQKVLSPTDYLALLALVDRKDGNGQIKSDPTTVRDLSSKIMALGKPDSAGIPNHLRADTVMDQLMTAFSERRLDLPTHERLVAMLERYRDRPMKKNPEHNLADDLIDSNILPPKGFIEQITAGELTRYGSLAQDMKLELNDATRKDPKLDQVKWVRDNLPRYKALISSHVHTALFKMGLGGYVVLGADQFDSTATRVRLDEAFRDNKISKTLYEQAINALSTIGKPQGSATQKRGEKK